jgi:hypothetical protein
MSAIEALNKITERYFKLGKKSICDIWVLIVKSCWRMPIKSLMSIYEDPSYKVAVDKV